jgi:hypothetical protein
MWRNTCWSVCLCLNRNNRHQGTSSGRRNQANRARAAPGPRCLRALRSFSLESHQAVELASGQRQRGASADIDIAPIERAPMMGTDANWWSMMAWKDLATASPTNGIFLPPVSVNSPTCASVARRAQEDSAHSNPAKVILYRIRQLFGSGGGETFRAHQETGS